MPATPHQPTLPLVLTFARRPLVQPVPNRPGAYVVQMPEPEVLGPDMSVEEARELLGYKHRQSVLDLISRGILKSRQVAPGCKHRVDRASCERLAGREA